MTLVSPPIEVETLEPHRPVATKRSARAEWRFAARLARREVRRRPGRTLLVMLLIAIPVVAMTAASVYARTNDDSHTVAFHRSNGAADLAVWISVGPASYTVVQSGESVSVSHSDAPIVPLDQRLRELAAVLPTGSRLVPYGNAYVPLASEDRATQVMFTDLDLGDPMTNGIVDLQAGRYPSARGELLVSRDVARKLDLSVGSTVEFTTPAQRFMLVGIGRLASDFSSLAVAPGFDTSGLVANRVWSQKVLVDLPSGVVPSIVARDLLGFSDGEVSTVKPLVNGAEAADADPYGGESGISGVAFAWGWVAGALALAVFGIVVTAAFATSARRQLVTLGQLSANGAPQRVLRRMLWLQGAWSGVIGAVVGIGGGLVLLVAARTTIETWSHHTIGRYRISAADLVVIAVTGVVAAIIAAGLPSRSIARVPTLTALAGRRPLAPVRRRLVPIGAAMFVAGVGLVGIAAASASSTSSDDLIAGLAIVGGLFVLGGACCLTPVVVKVLGVAGDRVGGTFRLAGRSLARTRTRSAAIVAAIAATAAFAIGASFVAASVLDRTERLADALPRNLVVVTSSGRIPALEALDTFQQRIETKVDGIEWTDVRGVMDPTSPTSYVTPIDVADPGVVALAGLSERDTATLLREGRLSWAGPIGPDLLIRGSRTLDGEWPMAQDPSPTITNSSGFLVTEAAAAEAGVELGLVSRIGRLDHDLTESEVNRLSEAGYDGGSWNPFVASTGSSDMSGVGSDVYLMYGPTTSAVEPWIIPAIAVVALLVTLLVIAVGLALSATESRDERDVLLAVGARPRTMRRIAGIKAGFLAAAGCVLAVPMGLVPVWVVMLAAGEDTIRVPWSGLGLVVLVIPLVAVGVSWAGSTVTQIVKPTRMSTLAAD